MSREAAPSGVATASTRRAVIFVRPHTEPRPSPGRPLLTHGGIRTRPFAETIRASGSRSSGGIFDLARLREDERVLEEQMADAAFWGNRTNAARSFSGSRS